MKILQLIDSLNIGGAERMAVNMANAFCEAKIDNILVCARNKGPLVEFLPSTTRFIHLNKRSAFDIFSFLKLFNLVRQINPTVLHAHSSSIIWGVIIKILNPKIKLIWHDHYGLSESLNDSDRIIIKFISKYIDGVVAVNQILRDWSIRNMKSKKTVFLPNFPYLKRIKKSTNKERITILYLANLRPQKDHLTLIDAARHLKLISEVKFQIYLAGIDSNDDYSTEVKAKIHQYELESDIHILGPVSNAENLLEQSDLGIISSISEGLPISLLEYGIAGLPVVVTDVGQCAEVVGFGKYGKIVPRSNPIAIANALNEIISNWDSSIIMGQLFREHVEENYAQDSFLLKYNQFVESI